MQSIYSLYKPDGSLTLQEFVIMFGALQLLLSQLPDIGSLRILNQISTVCTLGFTITCVAMSIKNGVCAPPPPPPPQRALASVSARE